MENGKGKDFGTALWKSYERLGTMLLEKPSSRWRSFGRLCAELGADPGQMDELLRNELGFGGREILWRLRFGLRMKKMSNEVKRYK